MDQQWWQVLNCLLEVVEWHKLLVAYVRRHPVRVVVKKLISSLDYLDRQIRNQKFFFSTMLAASNRIFGHSQISCAGRMILNLAMAGQGNNGDGEAPSGPIMATNAECGATKVNILLLLTRVFNS